MTARRPRLLDLFCCAGGASMGYHRAGFDVTGIDINPQPHYPFEFIQGDAIEYVAEHGHKFDAFGASPPCKVHTALRAFSAKHHVDLIPQTRAVLIAAGKPYVIENVPGAPLVDPIVLCGSSFDLGVQRHRLFESNVPLAPLPCLHRRQMMRSPGYPVRRTVKGKRVTVRISPTIGIYGRGGDYGPGEVDAWRRAMGIDWMVRDELSQAIPPAYTEFLGRQIYEHLAADEVAA